MARKLTLQLKLRAECLKLFNLLKDTTMGEHKNLEGKEAIDKMRRLIEAEEICMFTTRLLQLPLDTRPMSTSEVDEAGHIWFISRVDSSKNTDIQQDKRVQLFYANRNNSEFLSVYGEAFISKDRNKIEELWSPVNNAWFEKGKDDPEISLICVKPLDAYFWDTRNNWMISLLKIASAVVTGKTADVVVEGKLELNLQR
jgi:general stress protein 26